MAYRGASQAASDAKANRIHQGETMHRGIDAFSYGSLLYLIFHIIPFCILWIFFILLYLMVIRFNHGIVLAHHGHIFPQRRAVQ
jgi:hypothetical protein